MCEGSDARGEEILIGEVSSSLAFAPNRKAFTTPVRTLSGIRNSFGGCFGAFALLIGSCSSATKAGEGKVGATAWSVLVFRENDNTMRTVLQVCKLVVAGRSACRRGQRAA